MRILSSYVAKEFLKNFLLLLLIFVALFLIVDLGRIDGFLKHNAVMQDIVNYYVYKIPLIVSYTLSAAVLLGTMLTLAALSKHNEIVIMKAAGISIYRIILPILTAAFIISLFALLSGEYIIPITNKKVEYIKKVKIQGEQPRSIFKNGRIWFRGEEGIVYNLTNINPQQTLLQGITLYNFDGNFKLTQRVDAAQARWQDGHWIFEQGSVHRFPPLGLPQRETFQQKIFKLKETPADFKQVERNPEVMSYKELSRYVQTLKSKGYEVDSYLVDLYAKLAVPFISLIMAIIGTPFALRLNRSGGRAVGFALTLGIGFAYWVVLALGLALGHGGGGLPPLLAAWGANLCFTCLGFYLLAHLNC